MAEITSPTFLYAILGGIIPALLWLWFWLYEDKKHPEPKGMIFLTFLSGMVAVPIALFLELILGHLFFSNLNLQDSILLKILLWASIEEGVKYGVVALGAFRTRVFDEPIDAVVYMITAGLGFAALENILFLLGLGGEGFVALFATGNSRFLGATLLHATASGLLGASLGYIFYRKSRRLFVLALSVGLTTAIVLHTLYNSLIIRGEGENIMQVFFGLWLVTLLAMIIFEKIKKVPPVQ